MIPEELGKMFSEIQNPIVFATSDGTPHMTPMNWYYLGGDVFWVTPAGGTRRIKNMLANRNVCFANLEHMKKNGRGFIVWGEILTMETGLLALLKHFKNLRRALVEKSEMYFDFRMFKFAKTYHRHPHIYYSIFPWTRYFVKIKMKRIKYWLEDGVAKELNLS
ncbi:MAG: pyridoxamine 5'-phosphate oxidase family protein [Candidatus Hydrothermarchaeales archaeon]